MPKLFGLDIAQIINKAMGPGLLPAVLTKMTNGELVSGSLTSGMHPKKSNYNCRGVIEEYLDRERDGTQVQDGDRKVILLGASISSGVFPESGDLISIEDEDELRVIRVVRDPAAASYTCQVRGG